MRYSISDTARYGDVTRGDRIYEAVKPIHKKILDEIQRGEFAKEWILENVAGRPHFNAMVKKDEEHPVEKVGRELRKMMPWLEGKEL
jgi:ketol-acid reductoisomerase